jgi:surface-anchored protein
MKTKHSRNSIALGLAIALFGLVTATHAQITVLSSGHVDIFEAEYELHDGEPEIHLGVHTDTGHFEPGDVLLQVKNAAYRSTDGLPVQITSILGPNAWILPVDLEEAVSLGVIEAGVAKAGFPDNSAVTFTLVSAGTSNPGNFVLFSSGNSIRLSAIGDDVGTASFGITASHIHYNWGFSAAGTYTFDMQASYFDPDHGNLQSPVETYTFEVVPEPSTYALLGLGAGALALLHWRKRSRQT